MRARVVRMLETLQRQSFKGCVGPHVMRPGRRQGLWVWSRRVSVVVAAVRT